MQKIPTRRLSKSFPEKEDLVPSKGVLIDSISCKAKNIEN